MVHQRPILPSAITAPQKKVVGPQQIGAIISGMQEDIRALNSSILVISQKMQYLIRNEKILGRNLIVLSKRLKEIETTGASGSGISEAGLNELRSQIDDLMLRVNDSGQKVLELQGNLDDVKERYAKEDELKELKYVIDSINPLEFTNIKQVEEIIEKKLKEKKK
jgi:predicted PilT family ATPase